MKTPSSKPFPSRWPGWRIVSLSLLTLVFGSFALIALVFVHPANTGGFDLNAGTVVPVDLIAPFSITFESEIVTAQHREAAARAVAPIYTTPDTRIARQQVDALRNAVAYITTIRADSYASLEQKLEDLSVLDAAFTRDLAEELLLLTDEQWQAVQTEAVAVLQQVMRTTIREGQLEDAHRSLPTLVSFALPEEQIPLVANLASLYIAPNSFYSEELTEERRQQARDAVDPTSRTFVQGEAVVRSGKVLNDVDIEALQQLGLLVGEDDPLAFFNAAVIVVLSLVFILLFLYRRPAFSGDLKHVFYASFFFLIFLYLGRLLILNNNVLPFVFPLSAYGLLIGALFGPQPGMFFILPLSLLTPYGMSNSLEVTIFYILSGVFGVLMLDRARRVMAYIWAGLGAGALGAVTLLTSRLLDPFTDLNTLALFAGSSLVNGIVSGILALLLLFFTAPVLGKVTIIQLTELSRPDHPLLRLILMSAPGTYQHSLQVANLAEQAAELIGADPLLTRIGALYHDVGKANAPQYFIENQLPGSENPHENIDPYESSAIIIRHVTDGIELAHKHHLPERIVDFIAEHHGTTVTRYQYAKAVQAAGGDASKVSLDDFRYPGPRPRSRETTLVMIADGCEARARAERPETEADMKAMIKDIIDKRLAAGQLDHTTLTMRDLHTILESFTTTLRGIYHPRIDYPKIEEPSLPTEESEMKSSPERKPLAVPTSPRQSRNREDKFPETTSSALHTHDPSAN